ncbi:Cyclic di-GMP phosphodiesterase response regulator RpfG [Marinomonas aquimarina]|uniref:Cyclic di-GMP phosphodiesterase response regulator RpfG n=1 Tax=Marinomonas aquimarina TaxID=295068 RepID=A0A1A8TDV1_9GAMM|nr:HD domain-containing phosphohydrolase [Marinomonas aquimarina]SBS31379.1 Cyclic di-GMP phosphodiesterase response regulator RpfG [Marinomonas aquimarina]
MFDLNYLNDNIAMLSQENLRKKVLVVDDLADNINILRSILQDTYDVLVAKSGDMAFKILESQLPDIILLDIMMPSMNGYEVCQRIKQSPNTAQIPIIFITAMTSAEDEEHGFSVGAVDYITKPITPRTTLARVASHLALAQQNKLNQQLIAQRTDQLKEALSSSVDMLREAGTYNDELTGSHMWRMADYCTVLAEALGWPTSDVENLHLAASMHDTGKIGIPDSILKAPRELTRDEYEVMKQHSIIGHNILGKSKSPLFQLAAEVSLGHHEKWDGTGYPNQLSGEDIPIHARIVAIADVFDSLTMARPYKDAWPFEAAFDYLRDNAGSHFDPGLVQVFIKQKDAIRTIRDKWQKVENSSNRIEAM